MNVYFYPVIDFYGLQYSGGKKNSSEDEGVYVVSADNCSTGDIEQVTNLKPQINFKRTKAPYFTTD